MSAITTGILEWVRGASTGALLTLQVATTPSPTHRPRMSKNGIPYYAKGYQVYASDCQKAFSKQITDGPLSGLLVAAVEVRVQRPKTTKLSTPRGDVDNYVKGCLDAATKAGVWGDDGQLVAAAVCKRWTEPGEEAGVTMHVGVAK